MKKIFSSIKKRYIYFILAILFSGNIIVAYGKSDLVSLIAVPGSVTSSTITLFWDKPKGVTNASGLSFLIYKNDACVAIVTNTIYVVSGLQPNSAYSFSIRVKYPNGKESVASKTINIKTKPKGIQLNVVDFGAIGDGTTMNTKAIQKAIDACPVNGTVYIPQGVYLSGALFLKSNMTLHIDSNSTLKGSQRFEDYSPLIDSRFAGWELTAFASLLNAGKLDNKGPYNVHDVTITGKGAISGGGKALAAAMTKEKGDRSRGRLISILNGNNIYIQGLTIEESPSWTIHYIYSKNVTCHNLDISSTVNNGDGIDPDSSTDSFILNCSFNTNDDCIAIKSGKNPEGFFLNKPTENIIISECNFISGHGLSIGSETSGGIKNISIRDSRLGNLIYGFQIKTTKDRGGIIEKIRIENCTLQQIKIVTSVNYNNDGSSAPELPKIRDISFSNIQFVKSDTAKFAIFIEGFAKDDHYTKNVSFENIRLPAQAKVLLNYCNNVRFKNTLTAEGIKPEYIIYSSKNIFK